MLLSGNSRGGDILLLGISCKGTSTVYRCFLPIVHLQQVVAEMFQWKGDIFFSSLVAPKNIDLQVFYLVSSEYLPSESLKVVSSWYKYQDISRYYQDSQDWMMKDFINTSENPIDLMVNTYVLTGFQSFPTIPSTDGSIHWERILCRLTVATRWVAWFGQRPTAETSEKLGSAGTPNLDG